MQYVTLNNTVKLYVPSTIDTDQSIDTTDYLNEVVKQFSILFGGATSYEATGGWFSDELQKVVTEKITVVESKVSSEALEAGFNEVIAIAEKLRTELNQEAVSVEKNGVMTLIGVEVENEDK